MAGQFEAPQRSRRRLGFLLPCILIAVGMAVLLAVWGHYQILQLLPEDTTPPQMQEQPVSSATNSKPSTPPTVPPTTPPVVKQSTATIGATGDLLLHDRVIKSGYDLATGTYNYDGIFEFFSAYTSKVDYAVANLEVTLCGEDNGYKYSGYPCFNAPDAIVDAAKKAGFDMLLTANNHSFDTGTKGFFRTQEIVKDRALDYIGTRYNEEDKNYIVKEINGIKIGMLCYTYNTGVDSKGNASLNYIPLTTQVSGLVNTFSYSNLDGFYAKLGKELTDMRTEGAEAIMLYIHWGDEYKVEANSTQKKMAQALCDLGIDVIVGNHPHVPQPIELLTNSQDASKKTLCLYSTGNAISNIRRGTKYPPETEDGMLFSVTFAKYSDGTVVLESADILPTWVNRYTQGSTTYYKIMTMDGENSDAWLESMELTDETRVACRESYARTMKIVGAGLDVANQYYAQNQQELEKQIGLTE